MEIQDNTLEIDETGKVIGSGIIPINEDYYVSIGVSSYEYEDNKLNHVPSAVLCKNGKIIHESECHDSTNPQTAIETAENTGIWIAENYEQFI